jgi:hypothetical protein
MTQERNLETQPDREASGRQGQEGQSAPDDTTWNPGGTGNSAKSEQERDQGSDPTWNPGGTGNAAGDQFGSGGDESSGDRPGSQSASEWTSENQGQGGTGNGEDGMGSPSDTGRFRGPEGGHSPSTSGGGD